MSQDYITIELSQNKKSRYYGQFTAFIDPEDKILAIYNWNATFKKDGQTVFATAKIKYG